MASEKPVVLCVEDDPRTQQILAKILARLPVTFRVAGDPVEAIALAHHLRPQLLMLDLMLPGMSGWEVLGRIRDDAASRDMRVMILTAKDSSAERLVAANVAQVDLFLAKPFDPIAVGRDVLELLDLAVEDELWSVAKGGR